MSRYYNEDWQRRKAYLIRSLFHDIPYRVLSPVLEESTQSSQAQHQEDYTRTSSSQEPQSSSLSYEESGEPESPSFIEAPPSSLVTSTPVSRPYSPLPPLIIERIPDKHDEPIEYYRTLLAKMRRVYRKMILEDKNFDEFDPNFVMDDSELNDESLTFHSNGYNADLESTGSYEMNVDRNNDSENHIDNENQNEMSSVSSNALNEDPESDVDEIEQESSAHEEPAYSQTTFQAEVHIDGTPLPAAKPSPIYEERRIEVRPASVNEFRIESTERQAQVSSNSSNSSLETRPISMCEDSQCAKTKDLGCEEFELTKSPDHQDDRESTYSQFNENTSAQTDETFVLESQHNENLIRSPILSFQSQYRRPRDVNIFSEKLPDLNRTQVNVDTEANTDALHCDLTEKRDSAFVLRFRKSGERSHLADRDFPQLENNQDSEISPVTENCEINKELDIMRTPRLDTSEDSLPICDERLSKRIDISFERNISVENISNSTESTVENSHDQAMQQNVSNDVEGILDSIFNNSQEKSNNTDIECNNSRKRQYEEISVQTENVTWRDIRDNFFVGTPKIFKLCSCVGHHCI